MCFAGEKDKVGKDYDPNKPYNKLHVLKYNKELDLLGDLALNFEFPQSMVAAKSIPFVFEDDPDNVAMNGFTFIFAPLKMAGNKAFVQDPEKVISRLFVLVMR